MMDLPLTCFALMPLTMAEHGGFGLNLDIFETNVINLAIVIPLLVWFLRKALGSILEKRRALILSDIQDVEERLQHAAEALASAQAGLADAQSKAEKIRVDGRARADAIRLASELRTVEAMAQLKQGSMEDVTSEAARVKEKLRLEAANLAVEKALAALPGRLDASAHAALLDQSIQTLGNA